MIFWEKIEIYANAHNRHFFEVNIAALKRFCGIQFFFGLHTLTVTIMRWSDEDNGLPLVTNCMSRKWIGSIKLNIHLSDNDNADKSDKV